MGNELAVKTNPNMMIKSVDDLGRIGKMMSASGYFIDAKEVAQASVKVMAGMEMGFGPFASMTGIYIIKGKPSIGANLMATAVKANPKYDYRIREHNNNVCKIEFFEIINGQRESLGISEFTEKDAQVAQVQNMQKYARNMLFARAMSNGIKWFCPDVFDGNVAYVPEELGAVVDGEGNVISIEEPKQKTGTPEIEAQVEAVVEAEVTPIDSTPEQEKPTEAHTEAQDKVPFDEVAFLRGWKHKSGLPAITLESACQIKGSDKKDYGTKSVEALFHMLNAIEKKLPTLQNQDARDTYLMKLSAINEILTAKAAAQAQMDNAQDPFVKKGDDDVQA